MAYIAIRQGRQIMTTSKSTWAILPTTFIILYYWCSVKLLSHHKKIRTEFLAWVQPFSLPLFLRQNDDNDGQRYTSSRTAGIRPADKFAFQAGNPQVCRVQQLQST